jgi:hypothetical protein
MRIGSPVPELQREAIAIYTACKEKNIHLRVEWRPRKDERMVEADLASRMCDTDDYGCGMKDFEIVKSWAGFPLEFDLFASFSNAKCEKFAVRFAENDRRDFVNAFALNWGVLGEVFACPPPGLIIPTIRQFIAQEATGVLMIPLWKSSRFWPVLAPEGRHFINLVVRFFVFSPKLVVGEDVISNTFRKRQPFLLMRVNGKRKRAWKENLDFLACIERGCENCVD